jgi:hypothetical protein
MPQYVKGESGNPAGRPPGSKNKVKRDILERLGEWTTERLERYLSAIDNSDDEGFKKGFETVMKKIVPDVRGEQEDFEEDTEGGTTVIRKTVIIRADY